MGFGLKGSHCLKAPSKLKMQKYFKSFGQRAHLHYSISVEDLINKHTEENQYHIRYFYFPDYRCEDGKFTIEQIKRICEGYDYIHVTIQSRDQIYQPDLAQPDYCVHKQGYVYSPDVAKPYLRSLRDPAFDARVYYDYLEKKYKGLYTIQHGTELTSDFFNMIPLPKGALRAL